MKKLVYVIMISSLFVMPVYGQDNIETQETTEIVAESASDIDLMAQFEVALQYVTDTETKYTTTVVNIRKEPNIESEILGTSLVGTSFEIVATIDGWSMIITEDGYAYMKSDWFVNDVSEIPAYSDEDLYVLAHLLAGEAHTYPDEEQKYVASVVLNRVNHSKYPSTIKSVVFQKGQYACTWDGNYHRTPTERNWANAKYILENGSILPGNVVYQANFKQGSGLYLRTKYHHYCYY